MNRQSARIMSSRVLGPRIAAWASVTVVGATVSLAYAYNVASVSRGSTSTVGLFNLTGSPPLPTNGVLIVTPRTPLARFATARQIGAGPLTQVTVRDPDGIQIDSDFDFLAIFGR
jgi:hypothetical protein